MEPIMTGNRTMHANTFIDWLGQTLTATRSRRLRPTPISALSAHLRKDIGLNPFDAGAALDREKCP
jgi:hypothetical protein